MDMDELNEIDWGNLFNDNIQFPEEKDGLQLFPEENEARNEVATTGVDSWIEELLMKDDDDHQAAAVIEDDFLWSDLLLDSPPQPSDQGLSSDELFSPPLPLQSQDKNSSSCSNFNSEGNLIKMNNNSSDSPNFESNDKSGDDNDDIDHDPNSKKRKRQLRNRDAAMKSRERKKMYVKDLEMKSRYMEAECRRLGRLLQCCYAENQMLRISLSSAYGASMTKPESAVLSLESLLLVSLVWLMVNICLLPPLRLPLLNQGAVPHGSVERKKQESAAPKRKGTKVTELWVTLSFMRSKRCRASRTKMKSDYERVVLCF